MVGARARRARAPGPLAVARGGAWWRVWLNFAVPRARSLALAVALQGGARNPKSIYVRPEIRETRRGDIKKSN